MTKTVKTNFRDHISFNMERFFFNKSPCPDEKLKEQKLDKKALEPSPLSSIFTQ